MEKIKIILDTDIGDDVDDSFALALALKSPEIEILGITTVFKNVEQRAAITKAELRAFGRLDIPVHMGFDRNLRDSFSVFPYETVRADARPNLTAYDESMTDKADGNDAVAFMLEQARKYPGEITLVAIGPLTNVAQALRRDAEAFKLFRNIVIMGGCIDNTREWNVLCDPEAYREVYASGVPIRAIGANCTRRCFMIQKYLDALAALKGEEGDFLRKMFAAWCKYNTRTSQMHDALIIAELYGDYCTYTHHHIFVPLAEDVLRGSTIVFDDRSLPYIEVATDVDVERFMDHMFERLAQ